MSENKKTAVVMGGYGRVGRSLCRILVKNPDVEVVVAGRRLEEAKRFVSDLLRHGAEGRVIAKYADLSNPSSLNDAIRGADILILASPSDNSVKNVVTACMEADCDYFDLLASRKVFRELNVLSQQIKKRDKLFVTQGGLCPGLPSALVRHITTCFDVCRNARVGIAMGFKGFTQPEQFYGFIDSVVENRPVLYCSEQWRKASLSRERIQVEYGAGFGKRMSLPLYLMELYSLPEQLGLRELGAFGATPNWQPERRHEQNRRHSRFYL